MNNMNNVAYWEIKVKEYESMLAVSPNDEYIAHNLREAKRRLSFAELDEEEYID